MFFTRWSGEGSYLARMDDSLDPRGRGDPHWNPSNSIPKFNPETIDIWAGEGVRCDADSSGAAAEWSAYSVAQYCNCCCRSVSTQTGLLIFTEKDKIGSRSARRFTEATPFGFSCSEFSACIFRTAGQSFSTTTKYYFFQKNLMIPCCHKWHFFFRGMQLRKFNVNVRIRKWIKRDRWPPPGLCHCFFRGM